jgi:hypothetical protein
VTENALMGDIQRGQPAQARPRPGRGAVDRRLRHRLLVLAYLKRLPLDVLKIDRTFLQDVPGSQKDREIVQAIIVMAHTLHLQVVSEGVETAEQQVSRPMAATTCRATCWGARCRWPSCGRCWSGCSARTAYSRLVAVQLYQGRRIFCR